MSISSSIAQINMIVECLRKGETRGKILSKFVSRWQDLSERTFDRRLRQAEKHLQAEQSTIQKTAEQEVAKAIEERKMAIMTTIERQELLTKIATGDIRIPNTKHFYDSKIGAVVSQDVEELPDHQTRIRAVAELNKMDGSYSPIKQDLTTNGKELTQPVAVINFEGDKIEIL